MNKNTCTICGANVNTDVEYTSIATHNEPFLSLSTIVYICTMCGYIHWRNDIRNIEEEE